MSDGGTRTPPPAPPPREPSWPAWDWKYRPGFYELEAVKGEAWSQRFEEAARALEERGPQGNIDPAIHEAMIASYREVAAELREDAEGV